MKLAIIDYGAGNVHSVQYAFQRLGIDPILTEDKEIIESADKVIFPGVGNAASAMKKIKADGLDKIIPHLKQPVLGICLGMQLMCNKSEEGETEGLGIFDVDVLKFKGAEKIPHMGWNDLEDINGSLYKGFSNEQVYFVHSFYIPMNEFTSATTDYILPFSASLEKDNFHAFQYHPEKSGKAGNKLLENFIAL
jgi:glutamine amidotransferase